MIGKRLSITAIALLTLVAVAAPVAATAKPAQSFHYEGETDGGSEIEFSLNGKRLAEIDGYIMVTCVPTHGTPLTYSDEFRPPGSFAFGTSRKTSVTEYMSYKGDVTKNITVDVKPSRRNLWYVDLHVDYSYEEVTGTSGLELEKRFYICQGDDGFSFKPELPTKKR